MKKQLMLFALLISISYSAQYNNPVASQMSTKFIEADEYIGSDALDYEYFIKNNTLFKLKNAEKFQYKNVSLGKITKVDIQNSLRILLFYENFNMIIALDNQLNEIEKINFSQTDFNITASAIGTSSQNNYWIFNTLTQRLGLYNYANESFKYISNSFTKEIKIYKATYTHFYWIDTDNQLYSCSIYGKISSLGTLPDFDQIHLSDESVIAYQKNGQLYLYDVLKKTSTPVENIQKTFTSFSYKNQNLAIFTSEGITNYKINLP
ncbi:MAG: hypothetical protein KBC56_00885 [Flavobacterium sp.]|nr:hypothetical protein [Flavobacterium sp.]